MVSCISSTAKKRLVFETGNASYGANFEVYRSTKQIACLNLDFSAFDSSSTGLVVANLEVVTCYVPIACEGLMLEILKT